MDALIKLRRLADLAQDFVPERDAVAIGGRITDISAGRYTIAGLERHVELGDVLHLSGVQAPLGEVAAITDRSIVAFPFDQRNTLKLGETVFRSGPLTLAPTKGWLGRTINALGEPIDGLGSLPSGLRRRRIYASPPQAMKRNPIEQALKTGVKAVDVFTPLSRGQRIGIFAGSGVGKSTLLGMLAAAEGVDIAVIGLIGERGREVREFIEGALAGSRAKAVVVAATGDESALLRRTAALSTMTIAEHFRDEGLSVLLVIDSLTRFALACREIAIASGEPPVARGFPPSVLADLPKLLERAGAGEQGAGAITGIFSVLIDGDDHNDPIADAARGILDGHIVLQRSIAAQGRFPAIDIPASLSRLAHVALPPDRQTFSARLRALISRFEESRDLRALGGYQPGADPELDAAVALVPRIYAAITQAKAQPTGVDAFKELAEAMQQAASTAGATA